jgi:hypothetical protein
MRARTGTCIGRRIHKICRRDRAVFEPLKPKPFTNTSVGSSESPNAKAL